jgi:iron complex transport system ATP-binding protein
MSGSAIAIRDLTLAGNGRRRLAEVSLDVEAGALVGVIGPNGAGKSTLLKILAGVETGWRGSVDVFGRALGTWDRLAYARAVAYLPQEFQCQWALTVEDLVALGATRGEGFGWPSASRASTPDHAWVYDAFDLAPLRRRVFNALSGGEKARARLAAAVAARPRVLLADEPVANLDPFHQLEAIERLRALARGGTTILMVVHDLTIAARFCDRLILLDGGRVACVGAADEVLRPDWLAQVYRVDALFGAHDNRPYVIPWTRLPPAGGAPPS